MTEALVHLHGGPLNGQQMAWRGGDVLELRVDGSLVGCYRQSLTTSSIFVWQP